MPLTLKNYSEIFDHISSVSDEHLQSLLFDVMQDYTQYVQLGTPEELRKYKEISEVSPQDWMKFVQNLANVHQESVEELRFKHSRELKKLKSKYEAALRRRTV